VADNGHTGQTTCQGDSGGPSFMKIGGADVIIGITSYGSFGCVDYGSVTRVDLSASWIDPYIAANGGVPDPGGGGGGGGTCTPSCSGRQCGDDGCGSVCGTCTGDATCSSEGQCVAAPPPSGCAETEPNDSSSKANPLCKDGKAAGHVSKSYDHDWYTWTVPPQRTYTIDLASGGHQIAMTLYRVGTSGPYQIVSAFDEISKYTQVGGTYYLEVWGANGDFSATDAYSVSLAIAQ
jgi:hypothetical protein